LKRRIHLDAGSLERKLVAEKRGGYCFEQNGLFAAALRSLGFDVTGLAAQFTSSRRPAGSGEAICCF